MRLIGTYNFQGQLSPAQQEQFATELVALLERFHVAKVDVCWERDTWPPPERQPTVLQRLLGRSS